MDTTEPINSDTLIDRNLHQYTRIEREVEYAARNILQQSLYEEKLANNGLTANIFIHCICLLVVLFIFAFDVKLLEVRKQSESYLDYVTLDMFDFNIYFHERRKMTFSYSCIISYEDIITSGVPREQTCQIDQSCLNLNVNELAQQFDIWCSQLVQLNIAGIVYTVMLSFGSTLGIVSGVVVALLLRDVLSLEKCERIRYFTKFETVFYLLGFAFYFLYAGLVIDLSCRLVLQDWFLLVLVILSFANNLVFKRSFYNKLRIKARIY